MTEKWSMVFMKQSPCFMNRILNNPVKKMIEIIFPGTLTSTQGLRISEVLKRYHWLCLNGKQLIRVKASCH